MSSDFFGFFAESLPALMQGFSVTLLLTLFALAVGFAIGVVVALGRVYGNKGIAGICIGYIEIIRGTPLLVQLFILYFGLPSVGINLSPLTAALIGLSINSGAYQAEYLRGSLQSIESGQMVAARTLGMSKLRSIEHIILPQALRITIPAWSNELIYLLKYTSIAYIIQVNELFAEARFIASDTFRYLEVFTFIAIIYLLTTIVFTEIIDHFENWVRIPGIGLKKGVHAREG